MIESSISNNLQSLKNEISSLTEKSQQQAIKLIAVSKTKPISAIQSAFDCGHQDFGENYALELAKKAQQLNHLAINWHFIGQIQSNKTKLIAKYCQWIHSLSSIKIANRLNQHCDELNKKLNVLIQVNLLNEQKKSGIRPEDLDDLIKQIIKMKNLQLSGLMFVPPIDLTESELRNAFLAIKTINEDLKNKFDIQNFDTLSYGMSADWKLAIQSGSNCIRIGTAIFGKR